MVERLIDLCLRNRLGVTLGAILLVAVGFVSLNRLPIDAMPDVTTVQVQILTKAPALGPLLDAVRLRFGDERAEPIAL